MKTIKLTLFGIMVMLAASLRAQTTVYDNPGQTVTLSNYLYPGDIRIKSLTKVVIPSGTLIQMKKDAKIYVEGQGAQLYVHGIITVENQQVFDFQDKWGGIEVWGDATLNHPPINGITQGWYPGTNSNTQGVVVIDGGAIYYAKRGVMVGKSGTSGQIDLTASGGILYANDADFQENNISIMFQPYSKQVVSRIINSSFINNNIRPGAAPKPFMIMIYDNYGLKINDCKMNEPAVMPTPFSTNLMPIGIHAENSAFELKNSEIGFLERAVFCESWLYRPNSITITNNKFRMCQKACTIKGVDNVKFSNNRIIGIHINPGISYGAYFEGSTGYKLQQNEFKSFTSSSVSRGIFITNSGSFGNRVNNNMFNDNSGGIQSQDNNRGLQIKCNEFENPILRNTGHLDIAVGAANATPASLRGIPNQGTCVELPANLFSQVCTGNIYPDPEIKVQSNCNSFIYNHPSQGFGSSLTPSCYTNNKVSLNLCANSANDEISAGCAIRVIDIGDIAEVINSKEQLEYYKTNTPDDIETISYLTQAYEANVYAYVRVLMDEETDSLLLSFLYADIDDFKRTILIPILIGTGEYQAAQAQLNALNIAANDVEMSTFYAYYSLLNTTYLNGNTEMNFNSTQVVLLKTIANTPTSTAAKAKSLLTQYYESTFEELYYEWFDDLGINTGIVKTINTAEANIFPVPATNYVRIQSSQIIKHYVIFDISGRMMIEGTNPTKTIEINTETFQNGIYFIHLNSNDGSISKHKIVIQH